jgi:hypothetical protein
MFQGAANMYGGPYKQLLREQQIKAFKFVNTMLKIISKQKQHFFIHVTTLRSATMPSDFEKASIKTW